jgi:hypothetical protein
MMPKNKSNSIETISQDLGSLLFSLESRAVRALPSQDLMARHQNKSCYLLQYLLCLEHEKAKVIGS